MECGKLTKRGDFQPPVAIRVAATISTYLWCNMITLLSETKVAVICNICKVERMEIDVTVPQLKRWQDGELI